MPQKLDNERQKDALEYTSELMETGQHLKVDLGQQLQLVIDSAGKKQNVPQMDCVSVWRVRAPR